MRLTVERSQFKLDSVHMIVNDYGNHDGDDDGNDDDNAEGDNDDNDNWLWLCSETFFARVSVGGISGEYVHLANHSQGVVLQRIQYHLDFIKSCPLDMFV